MLMSEINIMFTGLLILFFALIIDAQNKCSDRSADCISIRNCPQIISILTDPRPPSAQILQALRNLHCGFESNDPKYCCNQITITTTMATTMTTTMATTMTTTIDPEIETDPPDVTNHPNLRLLDHQACGPIPQHRPINGKKTRVFQYPWMVLIAYQIEHIANPEFHCGGTIISSRYVLTAAHCITLLPKFVRVVKVRVGDHDIRSEHDCSMDDKGFEIMCAERYQEFGVDNVYPHPEYDTFRNDIGLIRLNAKVDFTPRNVKPICLPFGTAAALNHKKAIITGWGTIGYDLPRSHELQQVKLPLKPNKFCEAWYKKYPNIWYKQLCTGKPKNVDLCSGDNGGPLQATGIYNGGSVRTIQYGVVNFVLYCHENYPGLYTRVSYYMDWILNTMTD